MRKTITLFFTALISVTLAGCGDPTWDPAAATEFASKRANETHKIGSQLRDKCKTTEATADCQAWLEYQRDIEVEWRIVSYEYELERWEANGPY